MGINIQHCRSFDWQISERDSAGNLDWVDHWLAVSNNYSDRVCSPHNPIGSPRLAVQWNYLPSKACSELLGVCTLCRHCSGFAVILLQSIVRAFPSASYAKRWVFVFNTERILFHVRYSTSSEPIEKRQPQ